jgi:vancomycin resistance protein YoaR
MEIVETAPKRVQKRPRRPAVIVCAILGGLAVAYLAFCGYAQSRSTFFPNYSINQVDVGGMTQAQAAEALQSKLPNVKVEICYPDQKTPVETKTVSELGFSQKSDYAEIARQFYDENRSGSFFTAGWRYLRAFSGTGEGYAPYVENQQKLKSESETLAKKLSVTPVDSAYSLKASTLEIVKAKDGYQISAQELQEALEKAVTGSSADFRAEVTPAAKKAKKLTVDEIYSQVAAEAKNAGYSAATGSIIPEKVGAKFDKDEAQERLDDAKDGSTVTIPATIIQPKVTAAQLRSVLFRDVLGTARTHVGGSAARIGNVRLAAAKVNGTVLNAGDTFSYNGKVGRRTVAGGFKEAPAYVQGNTVNEVGGGVCQPSSTLYLACLYANLHIVQRSAHRYVPSYVPKGMDATVSWGGPDYKFQNNTDYPIRIIATYSGGYLTMRLVGTNVSGNYVKMTNKVLSTTPSTVVKQKDSTLPAGTQQVKVTPYTGYRVVTYRNVYSASGALISSKQEDISDYKVRNKLILVGTGKSSGSSGSSSSSTTTTPTTTPPSTATGDGTDANA